MVAMIGLEHNGITVILDETLGGEIRQIAVDGVELLAAYDWQAPVPVARSRSYGDSQLDWLSEYRGGWQLLVPNAGAACVVDGVPLPFHGEWSRTRVDVQVLEPHRVQFQSGVRLPLVVERVVEVHQDPRRISLTTAITNVADVRHAFVWGEHPAFASGHGDRIDLPAGPIANLVDPLDGPTTMWPTAPSSGDDLSIVPGGTPLEDVHFLPDRPSGWCALRRPHVGVAMSWDIRDFPHLWIWREFASPGFPFYGRAAILALEPASSWPGAGLESAISHGQAHWLEPGATRTTTVTVIPFGGGAPPLCGVGPSFTLDFEAAR